MVGEQKTLISRIKGGLGNQLFCYAAARRLSIVNQAELALDNISGFSRDIEYGRKFRLDGFCIPARLATASERYEPFERIRRGLVKVTQRWRPFASRSYIEQQFSNFDQRLLNLRLTARRSIIDGLWQSAYYFSDIEDVLRDDLKIVPPTDKSNVNAAAWIQQHRAVCIHVRWFAAHGSQKNVHSAYYRSALARLHTLINSPYFVIFSDRPRDAMELLGLPPERTLVVDWNLGESGELADLWLMSQCRHFIIANSTFSWWAAWLGVRYSEQLVFFPRLDGTASLSWAWDYDGQMPSSWEPILVDN